MSARRGNDRGTAMKITTMTRRGFLGAGARAGMLGTLAGLGLLGAARPARAAVTDFKALVCVYLYGGNDGNNMVVPLDAAHYTPYTQIRGPLALSAAASTLLPMRTTMLAAVANPLAQPFAFHYGMPEIDALYGQGQVAVVLNVGSLRQPLTKAQYAAGTGVPPQLYSHSDQTVQMQAGTPSPAGTGWGGRLVDGLGTGGHLDAVSVGGSGLFVEGAATHGNLVPSNGQLSLAGMSFWPQSAADARKAALAQILAADTGSVVANAANKALANGMQLISDLQLASAVTPLQTVFPGSSLASQLKVVAQLIDLRAAQGPGRQVYFVSLGGFDTHSGQSYQQWDLLRQVSQAMNAFQLALAEVGAVNQVTSFTMSDFGRTLQPASTGTDHAWGNHQLVIGAAVRGGLYGQFPGFALGGADDATGRGAWIPQFSNQQFGATIGKWFGADPAMLDTQVFKSELANFSMKDLGFMG
jgi:uncharacterized protein (DUF1501 family)